MQRVTDAVNKATGHVQRRPSHAALVMGALAVLIVVLVLKAEKWKTLFEECALKRGFLTAGVGNFEMAGNSPLWWMGNGDAGMGGSVGRASTPQELAAYMPQFRRSVQKRAIRAKAAAAAALDADHRKKLAQTLGEGHVADHMLVGKAGVGVAGPAGPATGGCARPWEPAAVAEVEGLTAAQAMDTPAEATRTLNRVIGGTVNDTQEDTTTAEIARMYSVKFQDA